MSIPEEAIEAAAEATYNRWEDSVGTPWANFEHKEMWQFDARLAISAAMPHIRRQIAEEIETAAGPVPHHSTHYDISAALAYWDGMQSAADIAEGTGR